MIKRSDNKPICTTNKYWGHICLYPNLHPINIIYIISKITYQEEMSHLGAQVCRCSSIRQPGKLFLKKRIASIKAWRYETRCWAKGTMCNSVVVVQGQLWRGWSCEVEKRATEHSSLSQVHCYGKSVCAWLCLTLCGPMDCSPPGSSAHGIFQARILEWGSISYFRGLFQPMNQTSTSCVYCKADYSSLAPPGEPRKGSNS